MDLRAYYRRIREIEETIDDEWPIVISKATRDGGRAGVLSEVPRFLAAKLIVEGIAEIADAIAAKKHRREQEEARRVAGQKQSGSRIEIQLPEKPSA
jgi:hypothetical protein